MGAALATPPAERASDRSAHDFQRGRRPRGNARCEADARGTAGATNRLAALADSIALAVLERRL